MNLKVANAKNEDILNDTVRINENYRIDKKGKKLESGSVCKIICLNTKKSIYAVLRGTPKEDSILLDEYYREDLGLEIDNLADFQVSKANIFERYYYPIKSHNIGYRMSYQMAILSFIISAVGFLLGSITLIF